MVTELVVRVIGTPSNQTHCNQNSSLEPNSFFVILFHPKAVLFIVGYLANDSILHLLHKHTDQWPRLQCCQGFSDALP